MTPSTNEWWRETGFRELRQILYWTWDPIHVNHAFPWNEAEYDVYAREIGRMILSGSGGRREIADYLIAIERDSMEMAGETAAIEAVASRIADWRRESEAAWREFGFRSPMP